MEKKNSRQGVGKQLAVTNDQNLINFGTAKQYVKRQINYWNEMRNKARTSRPWIINQDNGRGLKRPPRRPTENLYKENLDKVWLPNEL